MAEVPLEKIAEFVEVTAAEIEAAHQSLDTFEKRASAYNAKVETTVDTLIQHGLVKAAARSRLVAELQDPQKALDRLCKTALASPPVPDVPQAAAGGLGTLVRGESPGRTVRDRDRRFVENLGLSSEFA